MTVYIYTNAQGRVEKVLDEDGNWTDDWEERDAQSLTTCAHCGGLYDESIEDSKEPHTLTPPECVDRGEEEEPHE